MGISNKKNPPVTIKNFSIQMTQETFEVIKIYMEHLGIDIEDAISDFITVGVNDYVLYMEHGVEYKLV
jgi:hypothetical protein